MEPQKYKKYLGGFTTWQGFFMIAMFFFLLYITRMTIPIPNYNNETNTVLYTPDSTVPPTYVTTNHLFYGYVLLAGLIVSFKKKEVELPKRADIKEAKEIMAKYLDSVKSIITKSGKIIEIGDYNIDEKFIMRDEIIKGERKPSKYVLQINILSENHPKKYVKGYIEPFTRYVDGFMEIDSPLSDVDQCSYCGKEYDVKYLESDDIKLFKAMKEGMKIE